MLSAYGWFSKKEGPFWGPFYPSLENYPYVGRVQNAEVSGFDNRIATCQFRVDSVSFVLAAGLKTTDSSASLPIEVGSIYSGFGLMRILETQTMQEIN